MFLRRKCTSGCHLQSLQIEHAAGCMSDRYGVSEIIFADFHCGGSSLPLFEQRRREVGGAGKGRRLGGAGV